MKRAIPAGLFLLALVLPAAAQDKAFDHPYYPLKVGHRWTYLSKTPTKDDKKPARTGDGERIVIEVKREETFNYAVKDKDMKEKKDKVSGFVLKTTSGSRSMEEKVAVLKDGVHRFGAAGTTISPPLLFFKLPLMPGEKWSVDSTTTDGKALRGTFVGGEETIKLNLKGGKPTDVKAITVTSKDLLIADEKTEITTWYARDFGMVRQHVRVGVIEVTLELEEFRPAK